MKTLKNIVASAVIAGATLSLSAAPNFELYNKTDRALCAMVVSFEEDDNLNKLYTDRKATMQKVEAGIDNKSKKPIAGKQFSTTIDVTKKTDLTFWQHCIKPTLKSFANQKLLSGNIMTAHFQIEAQPDAGTIYLSVKEEKGKLVLYPQTGKGGLFSKIIQTTESGRSLKNNVTKNAITELAPEKQYAP